MPGRKRKNPERIRILSDIIQTEVRRVFHCVAVTAVVQHFDIISAVPEGSALLRRNSPELCKPLQAGRLVTARNDQINGAVTAGCGLNFPAEPLTEHVVIKIGFFFRDCGRKFKYLVTYFFKIICPLQTVVIDLCKVKKLLAYGSALTVCAVYAAQDIQDFRVFPAQIDNSINVNAGSAAGSVLLSI